MKNKRAQITVFVILALVILIAIGLYFGLREQIVKNQPEVPQPIVSRDVQVVSEFADKCLRDVTKQAIIIAGKNGELPK